MLERARSVIFTKAMPIRVEKSIPWDVLREKTEGENGLREDLALLRASSISRLGGKDFFVLEEGDDLYAPAKRLQEAGIL